MELMLQPALINPGMSGNKLELLKWAYSVLPRRSADCAMLIAGHLETRPTGKISEAE